MCVWWSKFSIVVISELTRRATFVTEKLVKSWPSWRWEVWKWISEIIQFVLIPSSAGTLTSLKTSCSLWRPRLPTDLPSGPQPEPRSCSSPSAPSRMNPLGVKKPAFQRCCCRQPSVQPRSLTCKSVVLAPIILHGSFQFQNLSTVIIFFFFDWLWLGESQVPSQGLNPCPLQWKRGVLITEAPGNAQLRSSCNQFPRLQLKCSFSPWRAIFPWLQPSLFPILPLSSPVRVVTVLYPAPAPGWCGLRLQRTLQAGQESLSFGRAESVKRG